MSHCNLNIFTDEMDDGVPRIRAQIVVEEVLKSIFTFEFLPVEVKCQIGVQIGIIPEQPLHMLHPITVRLENFRVRPKRNECTVALLRWSQFRIVGQFSSFKICSLRLPLSKALDGKINRQGVHGFRTHPIQPHRFLKSPRIILTSRVDFGHDIDHLSQWNTATIITHLHLTLPDVNSHTLSMAHGMFIDAVIDDLLEKHVNSVICRLAVSQFAYVHPRTHSDVFLPVQ